MPTFATQQVKEKVRELQEKMRRYLLPILEESFKDGDVGDGLTAQDWGELIRAFRSAGISDQMFMEKFRVPPQAIRIWEAYCIPPAADIQSTIIIWATNVLRDPIPFDILRTRP